MTKKTKYESAVRKIARDIVGKNLTVSHYILDDISTRYEKQILKELINTYTNRIDDYKKFNMDYKIEEKMLEIFKSRQHEVKDRVKYL